MHLPVWVIACLYCVAAWRDGTFTEFQNSWSDQPVIPGYVSGGNEANYDKELDGITVSKIYLPFHSGFLGWVYLNYANNKPQIQFDSTCIYIISYNHEL